MADRPPTPGITTHAPGLAKFGLDLKKVFSPPRPPPNRPSPPCGPARRGRASEAGRRGEEGQTDGSNLVLPSQPTLPAASQRPSASENTCFIQGVPFYGCAVPFYGCGNLGVPFYGCSQTLKRALSLRCPVLWNLLYWSTWAAGSMRTSGHPTRAPSSRSRTRTSTIRSLRTGSSRPAGTPSPPGQVKDH